MADLYKVFPYSLFWFLLLHVFDTFTSVSNCNWGW